LLLLGSLGTVSASGALHVIWLLQKSSHFATVAAAAGLSVLSGALAYTLIEAPAPAPRDLPALIFPDSHDAKTMWVAGLVLAVGVIFGAWRWLQGCLRPRSELDPLDNADYTILDVLQKNGPLTNKELSRELRKLGQSLWPSACGKRARFLRDNGYIRGPIYIVDPKRVGVERLYFMDVTLSDKSLDRAKAFEEFVQGYPRVVEVYKRLGEIDYVMKVWLRDSSEVFKMAEDFNHQGFQFVTHEAAKTVKETTMIHLPYTGSDFGS
jgi:DNA-binding Lrp family transcriptional regulator